jgi:hypothetical protein
VASSTPPIAVVEGPPVQGLVGRDTLCDRQTCSEVTWECEGQRSGLVPARREARAHDAWNVERGGIRPGPFPEDGRSPTRQDRASLDAGRFPVRPAFTSDPFVGTCLLWRTVAMLGLDVVEEIGC